MAPICWQGSRPWPGGLDQGHGPRFGLPDTGAAVGFGLGQGRESRIRGDARRTAGVLRRGVNPLGQDLTVMRIGGVEVPEIDPYGGAGLGGGYAQGQDGGYESGAELGHVAKLSHRRGPCPSGISPRFNKDIAEPYPGRLPSLSKIRRIWAVTSSTGAMPLTV